MEAGRNATVLRQEKNNLIRNTRVSKCKKIWSKPGNIRGLDTPKDKFKLGGRMITVQPQDWNPASMCSQKGRHAASLNIYITHHGLLATTSSKQNFWINCCWLVVYLPLWKMMEFVSWDDEIPNWLESHKIPWLQTTRLEWPTASIPHVFCCV